MGFSVEASAIGSPEPEARAAGFARIAPQKHQKGRPSTRLIRPKLESEPHAWPAGACFRNTVLGTRGMLQEDCAGYYWLQYTMILVDA